MIAAVQRRAHEEILNRGYAMMLGAPFCTLRVSTIHRLQFEVLLAGVILVAPSHSRCVPVVR
jgi:hypothetical protein